MKISEENIEYFKNKLVIYRIFNIINNKSYIGKCSNGLNRLIDHSKHFKLKSCEYRAKLLYRAIKKYGIDSFDFEILYVAKSDDDLDEKEKLLIEIYKTTNTKFGYNITDGGTGGNTWKNLKSKDLELAKKRLSKSQKKSWKNNHERKKKSSETLKNIRNDPIKSLKNREIASNRLKLLNKTDPRFMESRKIKIVCLDTGVIYNSLKEAALDNDISSGSFIGMNIKLNKKTKGLTFKLLKDLIND